MTLHLDDQQSSACGGLQQLLVRQSCSDAADCSCEVLMHFWYAASWKECAITYGVSAAQALRMSES